MIYLDHAASSPLHEEVFQSLITDYNKNFANPSSSHTLGRESLEKIEMTRDSILEITGLKGEFDLFFTSSATESNNIVIRGVELGGDGSLIFSEADHPSVVKPSLALPDKIKKTMFTLGPGGVIRKGDLNEQNLGKPGLAILSFVNNQSGIINDIAGISKRLRELSPEIFIHVDAVQGFGKIFRDLKNWDVDSFSVSAHKIGGPKGGAGLFVRKGSKISPLMYGGGQESGMRPSTRSVPLICGFSNAVRIMYSDVRKNFEYVKSLNVITRKLLTDNFSNILFPFEDIEISPYILTVVFKGFPGDMIVRHLEAREIYISTSSACSSKSSKKNASFSAMKIPENMHNSVLRISFSKYSTRSEVDKFIEELKKVRDELSLII